MSNQGGGCNCLNCQAYGFSWSLQNAKESELEHIGNLFYILCGHFNEKNGVPPYPGVGQDVKVGVRRVVATSLIFLLLLLLLF